MATLIGIVIITGIVTGVTLLLVSIAQQTDRRETRRAAIAYMQQGGDAELVLAWEEAGRPSLYSRAWKKSGLTPEHRVQWHAALLGRLHEIR
jgi:hypothetical protein